MEDNYARECMNFIEEEVQLMTQITSNEDYYLRLGVEKDYLVEDIHKAYKNGVISYCWG